MPGVVWNLKLRFLTQFQSFRVFPFVILHEGLNTFNPSIALHNGEIYFALRHSNILALGNLRYHRTFNKEIDHNASRPENETSFGILRIPDWGQSLDCKLFEKRVPILEDIRIFRWRGRWFGLGTQIIGDLLAGSGNLMHLAVFDETFGLTSSLPLQSPIGATSEKNWVPFCSGDDFYVVYRPSPLDLFRFDPQNGRLLPLVAAKAPNIDRSSSPGDAWSGLPNVWSGSSQFVPYEKDVHLGVVHRKFVFSDEFVYEHAFAKIRKGFELELSRSFHLLSFGIEFCGGLVARENDIVMSFGSHNDSRAYVSSLSREDVERLFSP